MDINTTSPLSFDSKVFVFDSGVTVKVYIEKVIATAENDSTTIESKYLDNYQHMEFWQARLSSFALIFRTFGVGFIVLFFCSDEWKAMFFQASFINNILFWGGILLMLISVVAFFSLVIDAMLELHLYDRLIGRFFSDKGYQVSIGNKSGNNIVFFAMLDELRRVKELEKKLDELKGYLISKSNEEKKEIKISSKAPIIATQKPSISPKSENKLDELKKLGELYQSGVLTEDEFNSMKNKILNK